MPIRKERIAVVFDTNIIIGNYLGKYPKSAIKRIFALWRIQRKLQLIVSNETVAEYLEILERLNVPSKRINMFSERIEKRQTVTKVSLGKIPTESRDVDDNLVLATALVGKADFLITETFWTLPKRTKRSLSFELLRR